MNTQNTFIYMHYSYEASEPAGKKSRIFFDANILFHKNYYNAIHPVPCIITHAQRGLASMRVSVYFNSRTTGYEPAYEGYQRLKRTKSSKNMWRISARARGRAAGTWPNPSISSAHAFDIEMTPPYARTSPAPR